LLWLELNALAVKVTTTFLLQFYFSHNFGSWFLSHFDGFKKTTVLLVAIDFLLSVTSTTVSAGNGEIHNVGGLSGNPSFWHINQF
jgi:hypothetical protein